jgi:hypothetical protein
MEGPTVVVVAVEGCPGAVRVRERLAAASARTGVAPVVREYVVATEDQALALGMRGSPTVLVDGVDVVGAGGPTGSLSCRLYDTGSGTDRAPSVDALADALVRAVDPAPPRHPPHPF